MRPYGAGAAAAPNQELEGEWRRCADVGSGTMTGKVRPSRVREIRAGPKGRGGRPHRITTIPPRSRNSTASTWASPQKNDSAGPARRQERRVRHVQAGAVDG